MRRALTVSLPEDLTATLEEVSQRDGVSRSEVVRDALRRYFALREFHRIRRRLVAEAEAKGILCDEDVFSRVS